MKDEQGRPFIVVREYVHRQNLLFLITTTIGPGDKHSILLTGIHWIVKGRRRDNMVPRPWSRTLSPPRLWPASSRLLWYSRPHA